MMLAHKQTGKILIPSSVKTVNGRAVLTGKISNGNLWSLPVSNLFSGEWEKI